MAKLEDNLNDIVVGIANYLSSYLSLRDDFGMRSFYGESFTLAFLTQMNMLTDNVDVKLRRAFNKKNRNDSQYHWEFNNYGMQEAKTTHSNNLKFKNTSCTNWTLLRANVRLRAQQDVELAHSEIKNKLNRMQLSSGLILDDPGVRSFQYHCFSAAMLYEIYLNTKNDHYLTSFCKAVSFIRHFILPNGDTLYVGRGQHQSFGYASLVYILCAYFSITEDNSVIGDIEKIVSLINSNVKDDGSLPLVMGGGHEPIPHPDNPHQNHEYPGWYAYNNYFDYLPFAGLFLKKAIDILKNAGEYTVEYSEQAAYGDKYFRKYVIGNTIAVLSKPGGYWTNDLPIPYIYKEGKILTPCYCGEQFGNSIYSISGIPLPQYKGLSLRWKSKSFFWRDTMVLISPLGILFRKVKLTENLLEVDNKLFSLLPFHDRYLFLNKSTYINSQYSFEKMGCEYSPAGKLYVYESKKIGRLTLEL